jgi:hypothetical protein
MDVQFTSEMDSRNVGVGLVGHNESCLTEIVHEKR